MPSYAEVLAALPGYRNEVLRTQHLGRGSPKAEAFVLQGASSAFATPSSNIHATGAGIRSRGGKYFPDQQVLKLFVYEKVGGVDTPGSWNGIPIDVEHLPIQVTRAALAQQAAPQRQRFDVVIGGISISPLKAPFVGTLGCFLIRRHVDTQELFALSNNHVLADVDRLPTGTPIVQPGPEVPPFATRDQDVFATLHSTIPIHFPESETDPVLNRFDAALANVTVIDRVRTGAIFGVPSFAPSSVGNPVPGMRVIKSGRTTGITRGTVIATNVQGTKVSYGPLLAPRIAVYTDTIEIVGDAGSSFSLPGDSGSVIVEESTGRPVALLFAGDQRTTTACDFGALCQCLQAWPA